ncbi:MAG: hypothetical protein AAFQ66_06625 [Pseudomonadota bacterium]
MTHIAFFGHNVGDAAVRRRAAAFVAAGYQMTGFMPHRGSIPETSWPLIDLGETRDNDYVGRIRSIFNGAHTITATYADDLRRADLIYARNLDMLALAARARKKLKLTTPLVYECLDVHHRLTGSSVVAKLLRRLEGNLLQQTSLVVVSSPRFETEHFAKYYPGQYRSFLIENRLVDDDQLPARPQPQNPPDGRLRIGWFGNLRCRRSLTLLLDVARQFPEEVDIRLRGYPALSVFPDFEREIAGSPNVHYGGRYQYPDELEAIYGAVDVVWAGDWYEAGANSLWLLPNRIYEGGYFTTPAIAPAGTETAAWLDRHNAGMLVGEPIEQSLPALVGSLIQERAAIRIQQERLLACDREVFVQPKDFISRMVDTALSG